MIFIVPATFMILDEFKKLRSFLSRNGGVAIIYLGPDVFKPEADVSSVVLNFIKSDKFISRLELLEYRNNRINTIKVNPHWKGEVITFEADYTKNLQRMCSYRLGEIYEIRIYPRTPEIRHSPYIVKGRPHHKDNYLPLLNGRNLKCNKIIYDNLTDYWVKKSEIKNIREYFCTPHIVVSLGFREDGRVAASYDEKCYPWMGDVYHLLSKSDLFNLGFDLDVSEVVEYLKSDYLKKYVKDTYHEITYHLSITQLKNLSLPNKKEEENKKVSVLTQLNFCYLFEYICTNAHKNLQIECNAELDAKGIDARVKGINFQIAKISQRKEARTVGGKKKVVTIPYAVFNVEEIIRKSESPRVKDKTGYRKVLSSFHKYFCRLQNGFIVFKENYLKPIIDSIDNIEEVRKVVEQISLELSGKD